MSMIHFPTCDLYCDFVSGTIDIPVIDQICPCRFSAVNGEVGSVPDFERDGMKHLVLHRLYVINELLFCKKKL